MTTYGEDNEEEAITIHRSNQGFKSEPPSLMDTRETTSSSLPSQPQQQLSTTDQDNNFLMKCLMITLFVILLLILIGIAIIIGIVWPRNTDPNSSSTVCTYNDGWGMEFGVEIFHWSYEGAIQKGSTITPCVRNHRSDPLYLQDCQSFSLYRNQMLISSVDQYCYYSNQILFEVGAGQTLCLSNRMFTLSEEGEYSIQSPFGINCILSYPLQQCEYFNTAISKSICVT